MLSLNFNLTACSTVAFTDLLEQISLRLSNLFLNYSAWDTKHRSQLAPLYAAWRAQGKASKVTAGDEAQANVVLL